LPWWARGDWVRTVVSPPQEGLPALYSAADVFVSGEVSAGWSNSVAEAMACGTPVVATPSGTADLAIDGTTAIVVPPRDAKAMRAAVERLRGDEGLRARLAGAARAHVEQFSWERCAERWEKVLQERL
ncbi:MAG: glycosyltransferase, partial [Planctomycetota bacterium]